GGNDRVLNAEGAAAIPEDASAVVGEVGVDGVIEQRQAADAHRIEAAAVGAGVVNRLAAGDRGIGDRRAGGARAGGLDLNSAAVAGRRVVGEGAAPDGQRRAVGEESAAVAAAG